MDFAKCYENGLLSLEDACAGVLNALWRLRAENYTFNYLELEELEKQEKALAVVCMQNLLSEKGYTYHEPCFFEDIWVKKPCELMEEK